MGWRIKEGRDCEGRRKYGIARIEDQYEIQDFRYPTIAIAKASIRYYIQLEEAMIDD
jgi:hypothetical protein